MIVDKMISKNCSLTFWKLSSLDHDKGLISAFTISFHLSMPERITELPDLNSSRSETDAFSLENPDLHNFSEFHTRAYGEYWGLVITLFCKVPFISLLSVILSLFWPMNISVNSHLTLFMSIIKTTLRKLIITSVYWAFVMSYSLCLAKSHLIIATNLWDRYCF